MDEDTADEIERMQRKLGFRNRSTLIRQAVSALKKEHYGLDKISGTCDAVLSITYREHESATLLSIAKNFEDLIKTEIHQHSVGLCARILIMHGDAKQIMELFRELKSRKEIRSVNITVL
ncbi:MAG: ribbon-helix-helix protein, CopG family [Candidatus Micrarchaeia archaeon]